MDSRYTSLILIILASAASSALALDQVSFERDGRPVHLSGKILFKGENGGLVLQTRDSVLWTIQPDEVVSVKSDPLQFEFFSKEELSKAMLAKLPDGFHTHQTAHYVICYSTSRVYAQWCGMMLERLHKAFYSYWTNKDVPLHSPDQPLVAVIFRDRQSYTAYAALELGAMADSTIGYYSLVTNRVIMYDLTGVGRSGQRQIRTTSQVNALLSQPTAERTVATVVHEATHQLAYNSGLQLRQNETKQWLSEGIATFFESPDLSSSRNWRTVGRVNRYQLTQFRKALDRRPANALQQLIRDNGRFQSSESAMKAYAESWALTYFLLKQKPKEFIAYLKMQKEKPPIVEDTPEQRLNEFRQTFGDLGQLETEFLRATQRLR